MYQGSGDYNGTYGSSVELAQLVRVCASLAHGCWFEPNVRSSASLRLRDSLFDLPYELFFVSQKKIRAVRILINYSPVLMF